MFGLDAYELLCM